MTGTHSSIKPTRRLNLAIAEEDDLDLQWQIELHELLGSVDSRIHRVMVRFIESATRAKRDIATMIDDATAYDQLARESVTRELESVRRRMDHLRHAKTAPAAPRDAEALLLLSEARFHAESVLTPMRRTVDQLQAIEQSVARMLAETGGIVDSEPLVVSILGLHSYQKAITIAQLLQSMDPKRTVSIQTYQPGRLRLEVTGASETAIVQDLTRSSPIALVPVSEITAELTFQASA
ncbi:MAG: hypothetical protein ACKVVP_13860 [Chloroflexota bacterium]